MQKRRYFLKAALTSSLSLVLLNACGFKLRQAPEFEFKTLWIGGPSRITNHIKKALHNLKSDVVIVSNPAAADVLLSIDSESSREAVVGQTVTGQVREKQLRMTVVYKMWVQGQDPERTQDEIEQFRESSYSETMALAKGDEETLLYEDMRKSIAEQLIWRLAALKY